MCERINEMFIPFISRAVFKRDNVMYKQENKRQAKAGNHCTTCYDSFEMDFIH